MNYTQILEDCIKVANERQETYGEAKKSILLATEILETTFGIVMTEYEFCMVIVSLKLSRLKFQYKEDSMLDIVNYICMAINSKRT